MGLKRRSVLVWGAWAVLSAIGAPSVLPACDTPVYRYAMYRWMPAPYEVYFFHDAPAGPADAQVRELVEAASQADEQPANVLYFPIDLATENALERLPPDVKQAWQSESQRSLPTYLIFTPLGIQVYAGSLDPQDVRQLVQSPARKSLTEQLAAGKAGVFLLLKGSDAARNQEVEAQLKELVSAVGKGQVPLYGSPLPGDAEGSAAAKLEVGMLTVDRQDKQEQWLVRLLLAVEDDLPQFDEPMVFVVYGRARALPPYIGKGINRDNLIECLEFITGACSCTIKEQNPGVDLLISCDWESVAAAVAEKFGAEEGNETMIGDEAFFSDLIIPAASPSETQAAGSDQPAKDPQQPAAAVEQPAAAVEQSPPSQPDSSSGGDRAQAKQAAASPADDSRQVAAVATSADDSPAGPDSAWTGTTLVGAGLAVAFLVLFAATFLVLRPR